VDIDKAIVHLNTNAHLAAGGECAKYVRRALAAGGVVIDPHPFSAKAYGPYLTRAGFSAVAADKYVPQKGDVVVIQNYKGGDINGHIAMYNGTQWVSDFKQRDIWAGPGYRINKPAYQVYRP